MAQIEITDLTNATNVDNGVSNGTGIFDKLMESVTNVISDQYDSGRLNGQEFATVLTGGIQAVLQESVQYALQSQLIGAQIDEIQKNIDTKERTTVLQEKESYIKRVAEDKTAALLGLDNVVKTLNATPEEVYTIKYKEV